MSQQLAVEPARLEHLLHSLLEYGIEFVPLSGYQLTEPLELFDSNYILATLSENIRQCLTKIEIFEFINSTNHYALNQKEKIGVYLAEYQTAGRGQQGRRWVSPYAKGICLSLKHSYDNLFYPLTGLNIALALTIVQGLRSLGAHDIEIKWPNDVMWQGRKLAGILLESRFLGNRNYEVVAGIGINVYPNLLKDIDRPWVDMCTVLGKKISRNQLASILIEQGMQTLIFYPKQGLSAWMPYWQKVDMLYGRTVTLKHHSNSSLMMQGTAWGIDEEGALLLQVGHHLQRYMAGEVSIAL